MAQGARDGDLAWLGRVLELTVTAALADLTPAIRFQLRDHLSNGGRHKLATYICGSRARPAPPEQGCANSSASRNDRAR